MSGKPGTSYGGVAPTPPEQPEKKPFPRLSSFKLPRDLTLGAGMGPPKPNKKVFMPNLNVVRNKNKAAVPNLRDSNKREERKRDRQNNKNKQNGPSVVKSSGVFSEGIGASERQNIRASYSRDSEPAPTLQRPVLRQKLVKIDKELEEQKIKKVLGQSHLNASDDDDDDSSLVGMKDAPIRLPVSAGGNLYKAKSLPKATNPLEVIIKKEPVDEDLMVSGPERKAPAEVAVNAFDTTDIVRLLTSDQPKMMLLQLPDNLPGRGPEEDVPPQKKKSSGAEEAPAAVDSKCRLSDLEEGRIGKIQIYKSGKVKLCLGDTSFDVTLGTQPCFRQDVVSVGVDTESKTGTMINLGGIEKKLNVIPDWEALFKDVVI